MSLFLPASLVLAAMLRPTYSAAHMDQHHTVCPSFKPCKSPAAQPSSEGEDAGYWHMPEIRMSRESDAHCCSYADEQVYPAGGWWASATEFPSVLTPLPMLAAECLGPSPQCQAPFIWTRTVIWRFVCLHPHGLS